MHASGLAARKCRSASSKSPDSMTSYPWVSRKLRIPNRIPSSSSTSRMLFIGRSALLCGHARDRQAHDDGDPAARPVADVHVPAVCLGDALREREAETARTVALARERLEDVRQVFGGDRRAAIEDGD